MYFSQTTLQMPTEIQNRLASVINAVVDTKINPETIIAHEKIKNLSEIQATSTETVARTIQDTADSTRAQIAAISVQGSESTSRLTQGLEQVLELQTTSRKANSALHAKLDDLSSCNSSSTTSILNSFRQRDSKTAEAIRIHSLEGRTQSSSLNRKLNQVDASIEAIRGTLDNFTNAQSNTSIIALNSDIKMAVQNMLSSIWQLISSLQCLIRELLYV